eukprot:jgi/Mesen1/6766/ME000346S05939
MASGLICRAPGSLFVGSASHFLSGSVDLKQHFSAQVTTSAGPLARSDIVLAAKTESDASEDFTNVSRRSVVGVSLATTLGAYLVQSEQALAVPTSAVAGRIPGLSEPGSDGLRTYRRPDNKSGGHGIGWSELIPYSFKVPQAWEEVPVSIADLGGTEIDLRFSNTQEGSLSIVVAPVLRFSSGDNAKIEDVGTPEKVIYAFGPELTGQNVEGKVADMQVREHDGRTYYQYALDPHILVSATAAGNRLYIMTVSANSRQWKKHADALKNIASSFRVG